VEAEAGPLPESGNRDGSSPGQARSRKRRGGKKGADKEAGNHSSAAGGQPEGAGKASEHFFCKPTTAAWFLIVFSHLSSVPDDIWTIIFQHVEGTNEERAGDGRRSELKGVKWHRPERAQGDSEDSFYDRLAGFYALSYFFDDFFYAIVNILQDCANIVNRLVKAMKSFLGSNAKY
jgi:hypothetical protein